MSRMVGARIAAAGEGGTFRLMKATLPNAVLLVSCVLALGNTGCNAARKKKELEEQKVKDAAAMVRAKKTMASVAALEPVVKSQPPAKSGSFKSSPLAWSTSSYRNFDVLFTDELAKVARFPKVRILQESPLSTCQGEIDNNFAKYVGRTACEDAKYLIVLRARTAQRARVSGSSYTPGIVDADAFVFELATSKLLGSGKIFAKTPPNASLRPSTAESDLETMLGKAVDEALQAEFSR